MAKVRWLVAALDDIERLHRFLARKDAGAAERAAVIIQRAARRLETTPRLGRPIPNKSDTYEIFMAFGAGAYVLRYRLVGRDTVIVIRVWHSREDR